MMAASVKQKIRLGTLFLFLLLLLSGGVGIYYLLRLKQDAKDILKDNYESLSYAHGMMQAVNADALRSDGSRAGFERALQQQEQNVTEPGEGAATQTLRESFTKLTAGDTSAIESIRLGIQSILLLNMNAIQRKNSIAERTADNALTYMSLLAAIVFLVAFTFAFNFPSIITKPIGQFTEAIRQVGEKNYKHRIHIESRDEFGRLAAAFNALTERLEYFENSNLNRIIFEKSRAEAVINSLRDASIGIDGNDTVLFANNEALSLLGLQSRDIVGVPVQHLSSKNDLFRYLLEEKGNMPFKIVVDNKENYFVKEVVEVSQGGASSRVIMLRNITSFKELDTAKTNFIATISHELKTPLASSDFSLKLLSDERIGKLSAEQSELIDHLKQDNQRMLRILAELLNMAQIEAGKIQMNLAAVDPSAIVDNAVQATASAARDKAITINKDCQANMGLVNADADKTVWVLTNFLTNAIRHSSAGGSITITVSKTGSRIRFAVADNGSGIPAEYLPKVFDRFFQVPGTAARGTGLGLAISREFIEAQGGAIWADSELGSGSTFGFDLPA